MYNQISMVFIFKLSIFGKQGRKEEVKKKHDGKKSSRRELSIRHLTLFLKVEGGGGDRLIQIFFSSKEKKNTVNHEKLICVDGVGDVGVGVYLL